MPISPEPMTHLAESSWHRSAPGKQTPGRPPVVAWWPGRPSIRPALVRRPNSDLMGDIMGGSFSGSDLRRLMRGRGSCKITEPQALPKPFLSLGVQ